MQKSILSLSNFKPNICVPENMCVCLLAFPVLFSLLFSPSPASRGNLSYRASLQQRERLCRHLKLVFWPKEQEGWALRPHVCDTNPIIVFSPFSHCLKLVFWPKEQEGWALRPHVCDANPVIVFSPFSHRFTPKAVLVMQNHMATWAYTSLRESLST